MFSVTEQENKCCIDLEGEMCIYNAAELKEKLMPVLSDPRDLEINLAEVTEIDSSGIQLLMLVKRERERNGQSVALVNHSSNILDIFELMALVGYFNDPVVLAKAKGEKHES